MKFTRNIIFQFTFLTFFVVLGVSLFLGIVLTRRMTADVIARHIEIYPQLMTGLMKSQPAIEDFLRGASPASAPLEAGQAFAGLLNFGTVFRVKVWAMDGTILWSDKSELIGQAFPDNDDFLYAARTGVHYEVEHPDKEEHIFERQVNIALEIYAPIRVGDRTIGVVELYEDADRLFWTIGRHNSLIWGVVTIAGLSLYLMLFLVFLGAHRRQKTADDRLARTQQAIISTLAHQAEIRDVETGHHLDRTSAYASLLVEDLRRNSPYAAYLTKEYIVDLVKAAPLHDIGKVGVPDAILCKPGKLTPEEFALMRRHAEDGARVLALARDQIAFRSFLDLAVEIAAHHHERWDGLGYPHGLKGEAIPLAARIMALADVYDALRSQRCYKRAYSHERSRAILLEGRGSQFDPHIVDAFLAREDEFKKISDELAD
ncbi:MAG: HD domain-containing phosphohydrolase [Thermodesulfobacteriota bacterium]